MSTHSKNSSNHDPREAQAEAASNRTLLGAFLWSLPPLILTIVLIVQALSQV